MIGVKKISILGLLGSFLALSAMAEFTSGGDIEKNGMRVASPANGKIVIAPAFGSNVTAVCHFSGGDVKWFSSEVACCYANGKSTRLKGKTTVDQKTQTAQWLTSFMMNEKPVDCLLKTHLLDSNKARITAELVFAEAIGDAKVRANLTLLIPLENITGEMAVFGGKKVLLSKEAFQNKATSVSGKDPVLIFNPDDPKAYLKIEGCPGKSVPFRFSERYGNLNVTFKATRERNHLVAYCDISLPDKAYKSDFESGKIYHGVDFWNPGKLRVPRYEKCRNLIQNPSFEAGLRYYKWDGGHAAEHFLDLFTLDSSTAKLGENSLKIDATKISKRINTFCMPFKKGAEYTLSFYAKADNDRSTLNVSTRGNSVESGRYAKIGAFKLSQNWRRYSKTFKAEENGQNVCFSGKNGVIWLDGLQLECGNKLTEYTEKPILIALESSDHHNFIEYGSPINAKLILRGKPETNGKVSVTVTGISDKPVYQNSFPFQIGENGKTAINLPLNDKLPRGLFVIKADVTTNDGFQDDDFFRLTYLSSMAGKHKNKRLFMHNIGYGYLPSEKYLERAMRLGIGSNGRYMVPEMKKFHIEDTQNYLVAHRSGRVGVWGMKDPKKLSSKTCFYNLGEALEKSKGVITEEIARDLEEACYQAIMSLPLVKQFNVGCEMNIYCTEDETQSAKVAAVVYKGFLRAKKERPEIKFAPPSTCNMNPSGGIAWKNAFLENVSEYNIPWNIDTIHTYRSAPESPDLDRDAKEYFDMLASHGLKDVKVEWSEGGMYPLYRLPDWYKRGYTLSYALGADEALRAAYNARTLLVALKYADKVTACDINVNSSFYADLEMAPLAVQKVFNTLARLLGNAEFKDDIRFAPYIRCYIFEDQEKRPVVALWCHSPKVDKGREKAPVAEIPVKNMTVKAYDLFESPVAMATDTENKSIKLAVTSSPVFLRGEPGTLKNMLQAIENSELLGNKYAPVQLYARPTKPTRIDVTALNTLTRPVAGTLTVNKTQEKINLAPKEEKVISVKSPLEIPFNALQKISLPVTLALDSGKTYRQTFSFVSFAVKKAPEKLDIDGDLEDWKNIPAIKMDKILPKKPDTYQPSENDLSAEYKIAWDENALYLAVKAKDDKVVNEWRSPSAFGVNKNLFSATYNNDTLQVHFDCLGDAGSSLNETGYDQNDLVYNLYVNPDTKQGQAFRSTAPMYELGGTRPMRLEPKVKVAMRQTADGYVYEARFPFAVIRPISLRSGYSFGFGLMVNDHDGEKWEASVVNTPDGKTCFMSPRRYPLAVLAD